MTLLCIHDQVGLREFWRQQKWDPFHLHRLRTAFVQQSSLGPAALALLPSVYQEVLNERMRFHTLTLERVVPSQADGASKLIFRTAQGHLLESVVLQIRSGRTTVCVSSQVGCAAKCSFCATGQMGMAVNLSAAEIFDQIIQANQWLASQGTRIRNVVFMGMGEPLHNVAEVQAVLAQLIGDPTWGFSPRRVTLSTVGILPEMVELAWQFPRLRFALSLHSAVAAVREQLIPLARRYPLTELRSAILAMNEVQRQPVMLEYLMFADLTDREQDLEALLDFCAGLDVHLNLIPYNPIDSQTDLQGSASQRIAAFAQRLKAAGLRCTRRRSLGQDVAAACGQLIQRENQRLARR